MPCYKLIYFNARGRAETPRLIMAYGDIDYEDVRLPFPPGEEWAKLKPTTPFGQMPILEVDGVQICQGQAISRFLAKKVGLHGKSDIDEAKIDMIVGCFEDLMAPLGAIFREKDEAKKDEMKKEFHKTLPEGFKKFENFIEGDYFLGKQMSWADINVVDILGIFRIFGIDESLEKNQKLAGLIARVKAHPKIAGWIAKRPETPM